MLSVLKRRHPYRTHALLYCTARRAVQLQRAGCAPFIHRSVPLEATRSQAIGSAGVPLNATEHQVPSCKVVVDGRRRPTFRAPQLLWCGAPSAIVQPVYRGSCIVENEGCARIPRPRYQTRSFNYVPITLRAEASRDRLYPDDEFSPICTDAQVLAPRALARVGPARGLVRIVLL